ncbi:MAG: hypothetical protein E7545_01540 [Ruminococcaceae bacterium]|nr:hypothetical protein [Oscillospiraceae bacterium]
MKINKALNFILALICVVSVLLVPVCAVEELDGDSSSYVFDYWGNTVSTPVPYETEINISLADFGASTPNIADMAADKDNNIYIADAANNTIWQFNEKLEFVAAFDSYFIDGEQRSFNAPEGCWVADGKLYVANTAGANIVIINIATKETVRVVKAPESEEWSSTVDFVPIRLSTDNGGRIYCVSRNQTQGIVQFSKEGKFIGFLGALKVNPTAWDIFIRTFGTKKMKNESLQMIPTEYTNLYCNDEGMVYAITETVSDSKIKGAVTGRNAENAPIRLLNPLGNNILKNNGYYPIVGDIDFNLSGKDSGASRFIDVAVGENGVCSLLDRKRGKIFTYSADGDLLYIFGGLGAGIGSFEQPVSMVYIGKKLAVLDQASKEITLFNTTAFTEQVLGAYAAHEAGDFETEEACWKALNEKFSGYDPAILGIGKALYNRGEYKASMEYFKLTNNKGYYSKAYKNLQAQLAEKYLVGVVIGAVLLVLGLFFGLKYLIRYIKTANNTVCKTLVGGSYIMTHPFDGFWDLKWENKGTVSGATFLLASAFLIRIISERLTPFLFSNKNLTQTNTLISTCSLLIIFVLWIVSSWCLTTLFDGKGNMKDIYIYSCYCLTPYVLFTLPVLIAGQFLTLEMAALYTSLQAIIIVYCLFLLVAGTISVHQFTLARTVVMLIVSILGIVLMMFLIILCSGLIQNIVDFITQVFKEISLRYS